MSFKDLLKKRRKGVLCYLNDRSIAPGNRLEDRFLRHRYSNVSTLRWKDLVGHFGCVNAMNSP